MIRSVNRATAEWIEQSFHHFRFGICYRIQYLMAGLYLLKVFLSLAIYQEIPRLLGTLPWIFFAGLRVGR